MTKTNVDIKYQWRKDGILINGIEDMQLRIDSTNRNDTGDYECIVFDGHQVKMSEVKQLNVECTFKIVGIYILELLNHTIKY